MIRFIPLLALALMAPVSAQIAPLPVTPNPPVVNEWMVQAFVGNAPMTYRAPISTPAAARTAATAACNEFGDEMTAKCLSLLKAASFSSLTASGPQDATYFLDIEKNIVGGRVTYVRIVTVRK